MKKICKNCGYRDLELWCHCPKIGERNEVNFDDNDVLEYCYNESGGFKVGDNFGCVHFKGEMNDSN